MPPNPEDVIEQMVDAYNDHALDEVVDLYAEDASIVSEREFHGRDEIREHFEALWTQFGRASLEDVHLHGAGPVVVLEGLHVGEMPGGGRVELPMAMVFRVEDGLIREDRAYVAPGPFAALLKAAP